MVRVVTKYTKPTNLMPRQYEPAWIRLKQTGELRLAVPRPLHKRVIKAVTKEKWMDFGYKFELSEQGKAAEISYFSENHVITFTLKVYQTNRYFFRKTITLSDI